MLINRLDVRLELFTLLYILAKVPLREIIGENNAHDVDQVSSCESEPKIWHDGSAEEPENPRDWDVPYLVEEKA